MAGLQQSVSEKAVSEKAVSEKARLMAACYECNQEVKFNESGQPIGGIIKNKRRIVEKMYEAGCDLHSLQSAWSDYLEGICDRWLAQGVSGLVREG